MDKELDALALASVMLEDNLKDKEAALALDERCVLLDGRINVATPPPSSIASVGAPLILNQLFKKMPYFTSRHRRLNRFCTVSFSLCHAM